MKSKLSSLPRRYASALREHLKQGPPANFRLARGLGRQALSLGLETLDLARIHEEALARLEASSSHDGLIKRAEIFFTEAVTPIEQTHRAALAANAHLKQVNQALNRRTGDLAASNRSLKHGIARRKTVELALKKSGQHSKKLLEESLALQKHLQHLAHRILSAQEDKRLQISHDLQDDIAQTLLGINVRLLTVKMAAGRKAKCLQEEIAGTQRVVNMSVRTIKRFTREFGRHHEP
jgi:signal transduction histidine kinase